MTQLKGSLKRSIKVHGVDAPVNLVVSEEGISMTVAGMKTKIANDWVSIVQSMHTPANVLSYLEGKPLDLLKHQAKEYNKKHLVKG